MYGLSYEVAKQHIRQRRFAVPTYYLGRIPVIDKEVHSNYFRDKSLAALKAFEGKPTC